MMMLLNEFLIPKLSDLYRSNLFCDFAQFRTPHDVVIFIDKLYDIFNSINEKKKIFFQVSNHYKNIIRC